MCSSTSGLLPALWLPAHTTEILDKSGTIAVPPINLLDRLISLLTKAEIHSSTNQRIMIAMSFDLRLLPIGMTITNAGQVKVDCWFTDF